MRRQDLEHLIRAAGSIVDDDLVVVGSQAILATRPSAPPELLVSMEADLYPRSRPQDAIRIDGAIGDLSQFHATYGYYAHGVGPETVIAPAGWQDRLVPIEVPSVVKGDPPRRGWCIEAHDLMLAKLAAGRERDWEFVETAIGQGLVDPEVLRERVGLMPDTYRHVASDLEGIARRARRS